MTVRFVARAADAGQMVEHAAVLYLDVDGPPVVLKAKARVVSAQ